MNSFLSGVDGDIRPVDFVYDPQAIVVIDVGPDGQPGQAGIDDAGNGITDDRAELGATKSDDLCHVVFGPSAKQTRWDTDGNPRLTLARGAFRLLQSDEAFLTDEARLPGLRVRRFYHVTTRGGRILEWMQEQGSL